MYPIIFLWSHPRSMSTAIERIMRERGDLHCLHEPFLHYYYMHRESKPLAFFEVEEGHPTSYQDTRDSILRIAEKTPVFAKDMSYYVIPELLDDLEFCQRVRHCFLIRNPLKSILSYYRLDPGLSLDEIGIEAQWIHYQAIREMGQSPVILEAEQVQADTRKVMGAFWQALEIDYKEEAFSWDQETTPGDWQYVKGWHGKVSDSTGIRPVAKDDAVRVQQDFDEAVKQAPQLKAFLDHHWPCYEKLRNLSLTIGSEQG
jgi:hypothetical protein